MAWYLTYRPQRVADLHLGIVREQLAGILATGHYAHAYLFAGPKGTGKTSAARILARVLNDPRNQAAVLAQAGQLVEPDADHPLLQRIARGRSSVVIEQDAASHRGIDDVRQLQDEVMLAPPEGVVRVVILDEVHMFTTDAFNALLKLLEEPPDRVVFILATTELHKVPATVQSRCQLVRFRQATMDEVTAVLRYVAGQEQIELTDAVAQQLAQAANGSFRDAIKLLEQVVQAGAVAPSLVNSVAGSSQTLAPLLRALAQRDAAAVVQFFQNARREGLALSALEAQVIQALQDRLYRAVEREEPAATMRNVTDLLAHLARSLGGPEPVEGIKLEVACVQWCWLDLPPAAPVAGAGEANGGGHAPRGGNSHGAGGGASRAAEGGDSGSGLSPVSDAKMSNEPQPVDQSALKPTEPTKIANHQPFPAESTITVATAPAPASPASPAAPAAAAASRPLTHQEVQAAWSEILLALRTRSSAAESLLRQAVLMAVRDNRLELELPLAFHKERLDEPKYRLLVVDVCCERLGVSQIEIVTTVAPPEPTAAPSQSPVAEDPFAAAVEAALAGVGS